jgi:GntR family transcriptional regulator, arabinose operon transcriptional repressor
MPLYSEMLSHFREHIRSGSLPVGSRLPTEMELARDYKMSRGSVRQAMNILVSEGYLDRVKGRGTFVRPFAPERVPAAEPRGKRIGLVLPFLRDQLTLDILAGVEQAAKSRGYRVSFAHADERLEVQTADIAHLRADHAAGLIIFPVTDVTYDEAVWQLKEEGVPFVLIDRYYPDLDTDYVVIDNLSGGHRATEHLLILGHTRIGFVYYASASLKTTSVRDRWRGYRQALEHYGQPYDEDLVWRLPDGASKIAATLDALLCRPDRPTAIFAVHDQAALDLLKAANRCGVHVPEDLALVGFDDVSFAAHLNPPLTTLAQPRIDLGLRAGNLLINRIEGQTGPTAHVELLASLIVRESCGARLRIQQSVEKGLATK